MSKAPRSVMLMGMMEMVGTGLLVGTIQAVAKTSPDQASQAVVAVLIGLIYMGCELSGAHYNPVVTLLFYLRGRCRAQVAGIYVAMQVAGATMGALVSRMVFNKSFSFTVGAGYSLQQAACAELIFTTILCFAVLTIALRQNTDVTPLFGLAIAGVVYAGAITAGSVSGASFNPAVSIGLSIGDGFRNLGFALFSSVFHVCGAVSASALFYTVAPEERQDAKWPWPRKSCKITEETALLG